MKKNAFIRICVWTFVALLLVSILVISVGGSFAGVYTPVITSGVTTDYNYDDSEEYAMGGFTLGQSESASIGRIDLHWVSGAVHVTFYDGKEIVVSESSAKALKVEEQMYYRVKNGKLSIQYSAPQRSLLFRNMPSKTLEMLIPASLSLSQLDIENVSSAITVQGQGIWIDKVDIENVSGSVAVNGLSGKALDIETVSGSIDVTGNFQSIDCEGVSGSQSYAVAESPKEISVDTISGGVTLRFSKQVGFVASLDSVSGRIDSDYAQVVDRHNARYGDERARIKINSVSGGVSILHDVSLDAATPTASPAPAETPEPTAATSGDPIPSSHRSF